MGACISAARMGGNFLLHTTADTDFLARIPHKTMRAQESVLSQFIYHKLVNLWLSVFIWRGCVGNTVSIGVIIITYTLNSEF